MQPGQILNVLVDQDGTMRQAEILGVLGSNGAPPFLVRWRDTRKTSTFVPDGNAWIDHRTVAPPTRAARCG